MIHLLFDGRPWFRAKSHGYGAGLPIAWQGWFLLLVHIALVVGISVLLRDRPLAMTICVVFAVLAPLPIYAARTDGGWRWRWGSKRGRK